MKIYEVEFNNGKKVQVCADNYSSLNSPGSVIFYRNNVNVCVYPTADILRITRLEDIPPLSGDLSSKAN